MNATLYLPGQLPKAVGKFTYAETEKGFTRIPTEVAELLSCAPQLVDVLVGGPDYTVYSVFDSEGTVNTGAMKAVSELSGVYFGLDDEDSVLRGPVLVVTDL